MTKVADVERVMEEWAPKALAEPGDPVGLLIGEAEQEVERILLALDVTDAVIAEAAERGCQLIVAHHPLPFKPLSQIRTDEPIGRKVAALLREGIGLYVAHTNFDNAPQGGGQVLAQRLGLEEVRPFAPASWGGDVKVVVFTPSEAVEGVLQAMAAAGAGVIGNYSHCSFRAPGKGTFLPLEGAHPYLGRRGYLEEAEEWRLEMVVPRHRLPAVLRAMKEAHPYEEVAFDVYPLENRITPMGAGRVGRIRPLSLLAFVERVKEALEVPSVRLVGEVEREVEWVAVLGGSGGSFVEAAAQAGAQVFVTGDLKHHEALQALDWGLAVVDAGHEGTEWVYLPAWQERLQRALPQVEVLLTQRKEVLLRPI